MTILQALDRYYDRMARRGEAPSQGFSDQEIGYALVIGLDGNPIEAISFASDARKTRSFRVPAPVTEPQARTGKAIVPYFLWDKPSYLIGLADPNTEPQIERKYAAARDLHLSLLANATTSELVAVRNFYTRHPNGAPKQVVPKEQLDRPYVFRVSGSNLLPHESEEAKEIWRLNEPQGDETSSMCLITGKLTPIARLHPKIGGFKDADTLVGFDKEAFRSYNKEQGDNAPTSKHAAFRYGAALNRMLDRGSRNRLDRQIGDATVVFWADAENEENAEAAETSFSLIFQPPADAASDNDPQLARDAEEAARLRDALQDFAAGRPVSAPTLELARGVRFHVLGLSPNAARLSVRFWVSDTFDAFAQRLADHAADLAIEPRPWRATPPSVQRLLVKTTALQEKFENIPPLLAGEVTRAVLTGASYPRTLLSAALMRLRAGDDPSTGWHAAAIRAVLAREHRSRFPKERPWMMSLQRDLADPPYQLGRLFAALEAAQRGALGKKVNATIRDRYFGAASATPASVFPLLLRGVQNHLGKMRKEGKGGWIEREIEEITGHLPPDLPRSLRLEDQGRFAIGYYHQRQAQYAGKPAAEIEPEDDEAND